MAGYDSGKISILVQGPIPDKSSRGMVTILGHDGSKMLPNGLLE